MSAFRTDTPATTPQEDKAQAGAALAVVEALYAFAEEPARWSDVIAAIDALPSPLDPAKDVIAVSIMSHTLRAAKLAERLNAGRLTSEADVKWNAILLSSEGRVRGVAGQVREQMAPFLEKSLVDGEPLQTRGEARGAINAALAAARESDEAMLAPFTLASDDDATRLFGIVLGREAFPNTLSDAFSLGAVWAEPLFALVLLSTRDKHSTDDTAPRRLGLTAAEARLAAKLVQGLQLNEIAAEFSISAHTARTQLKSIFAKTGVRRQSELLRLLTDASAFPATRSTSVRLIDVPPRRFVTLTDGRQLFYREYGVKSGPVAVYFHVGLAASLVMPEVSHAATTNRVRLVAFERPGFGQSTPRRDHTFGAIAADVEELFERLNIDNAALFGDGLGAGFAIATALRSKITIRRLALRSPMLGRTQANERAHLLSALFRQSWIIPGVAELMQRGIKASFVRAMMRHYAKRSKSDAIRMADPQFQAAFDAAIFDAFERTGAGLAAELSLMASGARADPSGVVCPIAVWHGADHPGTPAAESIAAFSHHAYATLHILPGTGSYLGPAVFDDIFAWLARP